MSSPIIPKRPVVPERQRGGTGCPVCGKPPMAIHAPFCSQGCRDRDLLQWLGEGYKLPGPAADVDAEE